MTASYYENLNYKLKIVCAATVLLALRLLFEIAVYGEDKIEDSKQGFWGVKTANTNWCESDYVVTHYIAEFGNTVSSLFVVIFGIYGLYRHASFVEARFIVAFVLFFIVGFGSVAYHATLWRSTQLMDELPMLWCNGIFFYILLLIERGNDGNTSKSWAFKPFQIACGCILYTGTCTVLVIFFDTEDQVIFLISYGLGVVFQIWINVYLEKKYHLGKNGICFGYLAMFIYLAGFNVWLIDRRFCSIVKKFHLHAAWHFFAGLGTFTACIFWMQVRLTVLKKKFKVEGVEPYRHIVLLEKVV
jgi:dihydroceramidase